MMTSTTRNLLTITKDNRVSPTSSTTSKLTINYSIFPSTDTEIKIRMTIMMSEGARDTSKILATTTSWDSRSNSFINRTSTSRNPTSSTHNSLISRNKNNSSSRNIRRWSTSKISLKKNAMNPKDKNQVSSVLWVLSTPSASLKEELKMGSK